MWLVVGLGNADKAYVETRHNIGFMVIDSLAYKLSIQLKQKTKYFKYVRGFIRITSLSSIKPLPYLKFFVFCFNWIDSL